MKKIGIEGGYTATYEINKGDSEAYEIAITSPQGEVLGSCGCCSGVSWKESELIKVIDTMNAMLGIPDPKAFVEAARRVVEEDDVEFWDDFEQAAIKDLAETMKSCSDTLDVDDDREQERA